VRICDALAAEMLAPVNSATYIATHIGHLGIKMSAALGMIHPAIPPPRRRNGVGAAQRRHLRSELT
jgi:hypothetical protein